MDSMPKVKGPDYVSPLMGHPTVPVQHYNNCASAVGPARPVARTPRIFGGHCKICNLKLNSYTQSKSHYEGKPHQRKKKALDEANEVKTDKTDLTVKKNRPQDHYLGRNHSRVLHGLAPYNQGYFNSETNRWQREPLDPRVEAQLLSSDPPEDAEGKPANPEKPKIRGKFHCEVCSCSLTCQAQLDAHLLGSRHTKTVKRRELESVGNGSSAAVDAALGREVANSSAAAVPFKCKVCNVTVNSVMQYDQHNQSKKHLKKLADEEAISKKNVD